MNLNSLPPNQQASNTLTINTLNHLRAFVYESVCDREHLEVGAFPMTERILLRGGKPCGIYFSIHGPRNVRFTAIWETETNSILFYGSSGERFARTQLTDNPKLLQVAA